jgi:magnesium-transporting ATPase (P-type)
VNKSLKELLRQSIEMEQKKTFRVIAIAFRDVELTPTTASQSEDELARDLTLLACFCMKDPLRPEIPTAIEKCRRAHISVVMITGDAVETAIAIAKEATILPDDFHYHESENVVMMGKDFEELVVVCWCRR